ncbi:type IV toxin-antitoxin system AbiEi family antitoxin domain-containing protein [Patulibacter sp.]|uniref:type IV toxin-antitoxin system AbiEi family antitoxin domain-containing protein n=1 Tax=Patulibacter sp. TaxID=1912859 RepID=UPI00271D4D3A|nr:type IV toxin-antitoxin system AbiEi family antitoxin domain-containing protein [Patulibacter sp.]MDO9408917.1 type IV toxin-antitoxin system AbiEi family antitoxin domain-containing protein [Patulibacter sp.]
MTVPVKAAVNAQLAAVASRQLGLITLAQLTACGLGRGAVAHRVASGTLLRVAPAVYALGRPPAGRDAWALAAVLSVRGDAWICGRSAGHAWRLLPGRPSGDVELCVVGGGTRSRAGVDVRRLTRLDGRDRARRGPLPVLGLERTVIDLAPMLREDELERVTAEAIAVHGLTAPALRSALDRAPTARGSGAVRRLLADADGPRRTVSEAEREFLRFVREAGLPIPRTNVRVGRFTVDALWDDRGMVGEIDSFRFHRSRRSFENDRARDGELQARGLVVTRVTWRQMTEHRVVTAGRLGAALAVRAYQWGGGPGGTARAG